MPENGQLTEQEITDVQMELLQERISELETQLQIEDIGWTRLSGELENEFSREGLDRIIRSSRLNYRKNPLINHAVEVQVHYVIGQGVSVKAANDRVNAVIQRFWDDAGNRAELTSQQAMMAKETTLQTTGNVFMVLFPNTSTGHVKVRSIPVDEIREIICNPEDAREPWYYKRVWNQRVLEQSGDVATHQQTAYYPDWHYQPSPEARLKSINGSQIMWSSPVYHIKAGGLETDRFGVPEIYPALDWARAVKEQMEDHATLLKAHARFAWKLTTPGGARGVAAARTKLNTTISETNRVEGNRPPAAGSTWIGADGYGMDPVRTAGMTPHPEDSRRLWLMVAAATGIPETILTGNADVGNLATAKTLDRPTELKMSARQSLWDDILKQILDYVIDWSVRAPQGDLKGKVDTGQDGHQIVTLANDPETNEPIDRHIDLDFPTILDRDIAERVDAVVSAATLDGKARAGTMTEMLAAKLLLEALGVDDIDEELLVLFPDGETDPEAPDDDDDKEPFPERPNTEAMMVEAVRELRAAIAEGSPV